MSTALFVGGCVIGGEDLLESAGCLFKLVVIDGIHAKRRENSGLTEAFVTVRAGMDFPQNLFVYAFGIVPPLHLSIQGRLRKFEGKIAGIPGVKLFKKFRRLFVALL